LALSRRNLKNGGDMMKNRVDHLKEVLDAERPFSEGALKELQDYYKIGLTWSSNALEGNTLTMSETKVVLEDGLTVGGRPLRDFYETVGHGEAFDHMLTLAGERQIRVEDIKALHRLFYRKVDEPWAGVWRDRPVFVTGSSYVFPAPAEIESEMQLLEDWAFHERERLHPVEYAALLHLKLVSVHPFLDGNGRVSRLVMNLSLLQDGYQMAIIPPICRAEYLDAVRRYQLQQDSGKFVSFITQRVVETEKEILRLLHIPFSLEG